MKVVSNDCDNDSRADHASERLSALEGKVTDMEGGCHEHKIL